jgi:hypothetical protein
MHHLGIPPFLNWKKLYSSNGDLFLVAYYSRQQNLLPDYCGVTGNVQRLSNHPQDRMLQPMIAGTDMQISSKNSPEPTKNLHQCGIAGGGAPAGHGQPEWACRMAALDGPGFSLAFVTGNFIPSRPG